MIHRIEMVLADAQLCRLTSATKDDAEKRYIYSLATFPNSTSAEEARKSIIKRSEC